MSGVLRRVVESVALSLDTGGKIVLSAPVNFNNSGSGAFPEKDTIITYMGVEYTNLVQGFGLEYPNAGTLEPTDNQDCLEVTYTHNEPSNQTICFFAKDGRISKISIIRVPIHDHSTIYQGGPAHGTYYSEAELQGDDT